MCQKSQWPLDRRAQWNSNQQGQGTFNLPQQTECMISFNISERSQDLNLLSKGTKAALVEHPSGTKLYFNSFPVSITTVSLSPYQRYLLNVVLCLILSMEPNLTHILFITGFQMVQWYFGSFLHSQQWFMELGSQQTGFHWRIIQSFCFLLLRKNPLPTVSARASGGERSYLWKISFISSTLGG